VFLWTMIPLYHLFLFAISVERLGDLRTPVAQRADAAELHHRLSRAALLLNHFWLQLFNSVVIAVAVAVLTLFIATCARSHISRLKLVGGRTVMNWRCSTYFIPAAFLAVPMYKTMASTACSTTSGR